MKLTPSLDSAIAHILYNNGAMRRGAPTVEFQTEHIKVDLLTTRGLDEADLIAADAELAKLSDADLKELCLNEYDCSVETTEPTSTILLHVSESI